MDNQAMLRTVVVVLLASLSFHAQPRKPVRSIIMVSDLQGKTREVARFEQLVEAPNWHRDGRLLVNSLGKLWWVQPGKNELLPIATGSVEKINNDHGIAPDGRTLVISAGHMYIMPVKGGTPRQLTEKAPSYYHGWSPDGKRLAYCAQRDGNFDIYDIGFDGGPERRLTMDAKNDDGPDYTPDGRWIYFNSNRTGHWKIWRMPATGAGAEDRAAEQITNDDREDWFLHPSPDGRWGVMLSYEHGVEGHPPDKDVSLRLMPMKKGKADFTKVREVVKLFGGQGTINVNSWSPNSREFAYVRYQLLP
jgi:TolB protein